MGALSDPDVPRCCRRIPGIWVFASAGGDQEQIRKRMSSVHKGERRGDVAWV